MKKIISILIIVILLSINICSFAVTKSELQNQQDNIQNKKDEAEEQLDGVQAELSQTMQEVQKLSESIAENEDKLVEINNKLADLEKEIDTAKAELQEAEANYAKQKDTLEERVLAQYKVGKTTYLDVLLNSSSLSNFISNYYLVKKIAKYDDELLNEIEQERIKIEETKKQLETKESEFKVEKANQEKTNVLLKNNKALKTSYVNKLNSDEKALQQKIDDYQKEMDQIEAEIKKIASSANNNTNGGGPIYTGGSLTWPCPGYSRISSYFGNRESPGGGVGSRNHKGIDMAAPHGVSILSAESGTVIKVSNTCSHDYPKTVATKCSCGGGYGNYVMINHGNGMVTIYAHMASISVSTGQTVSAGQQIGTVGSTGYSTGNHLHFGTLLNGIYVNPAPYLGM